MENTEIQAWLFRHQDLKYREFNASLIPNLPKDYFVGGLTPAHRKFAYESFRSGESATFLDTLPHTCFEENQLHAFILNEYQDFDEILAENKIGFFSVSTYNTDYILVKKENYAKALKALSDAGYTVI